MSVPLDDLYGTGTSLAFRTRLEVPGASRFDYLERSSADAPARAVVDWFTRDEESVGHLEVNFYPDRAHYSHLFVGVKHRGKGVYDALIRQQSAWYPTIGVKMVTASPHDPRSEWLLMMGGFEWIGGTFAGRHNGRMGEYWHHLEGGPEPTWLPGLRAREVAGTGSF